VTEREDTDTTYCLHFATWPTQTYCDRNRLEREKNDVITFLGCFKVIKVKKRELL